MGRNADVISPILKQPAYLDFEFMTVESLDSLAPRFHTLSHTAVERFNLSPHIRLWLKSGDSITRNGVLIAFAGAYKITTENRLMGHSQNGDCALSNGGAFLAKLLFGSFNRFHAFRPDRQWRRNTQQRVREPWRQWLKGEFVGFRFHAHCFRQ